MVEPFKRNVYGEWSRDWFADAAIVHGDHRTIYVAGMAAEDPQDGHIHHPGDCTAQTRMAYDKIKKILAAEGADFTHIVRTTVYLTDIRELRTFEEAKRAALGDVEPSPQSLIEVSNLAWPGMVVEVEVTAVVPGA